MVDFVDYLAVKAVIFGIAAFAWGVYCGLHGLEINGRPPTREPSATEDRQP